MATTVADLTDRQRRLQLKELLNKRYIWMDYKWDLVFWVTAIFVVGGAAQCRDQCGVPCRRRGGFPHVAPRRRA